MMFGLTLGPLNITAEDWEAILLIVLAVLGGGGTVIHRIRRRKDDKDSDLP